MRVAETLEPHKARSSSVFTQMNYMARHVSSGQQSISEGILVWRASKRVTLFHKFSSLKMVNCTKVQDPMVKSIGCVYEKHVTGTCLFCIVVFLTFLVLHSINFSALGSGDKQVNLGVVRMLLSSEPSPFLARAKTTTA